MVRYSVDDLFDMKSNHKSFNRFVAISSEWISVESFKLSKRLNVDISESKTWLMAGLWDAIQRLDDRAHGVGIVYLLAKQYANKVYASQYGTTSGRIESNSDSVHVSDGEFTDIDIVDESEQSNIDYKDFIDKLENKVSSRDFDIINRRLEGETFESIAKKYQVSKQAISLTFKKHVNTMRRMYA